MIRFGDVTYQIKGLLGDRNRSGDPPRREKRLRAKHRIHITACHLRSAIHSKFRNLGNSIPIKELTKGMSGRGLTSSMRLHTALLERAKHLYEKYESEFEEGEGEGALDPQEDLFNHIVWAPRIWLVGLPTRMRPPECLLGSGRSQADTYDRRRKDPHFIAPGERKFDRGLVIEDFFYLLQKATNLAFNPSTAPSAFC
ncbi:hypothetical protein KY290_025744 [Solanum tuberosum]|uniref:Uncharacterized protein n=1 Tax=Solanum tuberosum TaxID=4113 RepID=A0ABQ7UUF6_SOLTU|nr:hypothetical protein KY289_024803 [Solanum tuberosum]KAH0676758.1 hypothetical protein KY285_024559 [Solanum tuberosum]KAH0755474.1 hypothetical protein KY290_025744 [Solanum tuberosum]